MKKLIIVRHAKSSWEDEISDKNRPLTPAGIDRAKHHAQLLSAHLDDMPKYWVSSFAIRALHTAVIFSSEFNQVENLRIQESLYTFLSGELQQAIAQFPNDVDSAILFGHNDACHQTIVDYTGVYIREFKTASLACIEFDKNDWEDISNGQLKFIISKGEIK